MRRFLLCIRDALFQARGQRRGVRVTLCLSESPELIDVPWEYLFDDPDFLAVSAFTPVVRYLDLPRGHRPLLVEPPLRLLGVVSSPSDYEQLDVERERSNLEGALSELSGAGAIELHWLERPTLGGLLRALQSDTFHALHYIGHGAFDGERQTGDLLFEDDAGWARPVSGDKLGMIVHDFSSLRLIVLNACEGARTGRTDPFAGVAGSLVRRDIPAVVAMQFEISDEAAIVFAGGFYRPLAAGAPVDTSVAAARLAMLAERSDDIEWGTPVLFMRVPDGRLFDLDAEPGLRDAQAAEETDIATDAAVTDDVPVVATSARNGLTSATPTRGDGAATAEAAGSAPGDLTRAGRRRRGGRRLLVAGAVAVAFFIVAGVVALTGDRAGGKKPNAPFIASVRPFTIRYAWPWRSVAETSPALQSSHRLVYQHEMLDVGQLKTPAPVPGGAPPALTARYGKADVSVNARVAGHEGRQYTWLSSRGEVVAYVLPTTVGDDAIICHGPTSAAVALQSCGDLARRADASGETILMPGPDRRLAAGIASALRPVATARAGVRGLGGPATIRAREASSVATAEAAAIKALKRLSRPPRYQPTVATLSAALEHEGSGFTTLANDARSDNLNAYPGAVKDFTASSRALAGAVAAIADYQLGVPSMRALSISSSLPAKPVSPPPPTTSATLTSPSTTPTIPSTPTIPYIPPSTSPPPSTTPTVTTPAK